MMKFIILFVLFVATCQALDNGMARKPPMGWLSWTAFYCEVDCKSHPDGCINEQLYKTQADLLVSEGYKDVGYEFVNVDDCWSEKQRDPVTKRMVPDKERFPSGIKSLADYMHAKGLKFGIYTDIGTETCGHYPGELAPGGGNFFDVDAETFAEWEIDSLKVDGCNVDQTKMGKLYEEFGDALNKSGRHLVYYCSMPFFQARSGPHYKPEEIDFALMRSKCNGWRYFDDINNSWDSVKSIIDFWQAGVDVYREYQGPGAWFDPDMLIIGLPYDGQGKGLTTHEAKTQMAFWSIMSAPLLMSNDLRKVAPELKAILQNKHAIEIDQDERGAMPWLAISGDVGIWLKPLEKENEFAALWYNFNPNKDWVLRLSCPIERVVGPDVDGLHAYDVFNNGSYIGDIKKYYMIGFDMEYHESQMARLVTYKNDGSLSDYWKTGKGRRISISVNEPLPCFLTRPRLTLQ